MQTREIVDTVYTYLTEHAVALKKIHQRNMSNIM